MNQKKFRLLTFLAVALLALGVNFMTFELRYMWYVSTNDAQFLRIGYFVCILSIVMFWLLFPSPILVAALGLMGLIFPPLLRSDVFVSVDWQFAGFVVLSLLLLVGATKLCQRL